MCEQPAFCLKINSIIFFIALGILGIIVHFILTCLLLGYNLKFTHNIINKNQTILPSWVHFTELFEKGAIWLGISIVYWITVISITIGLTAIFKIPYNFNPIFSLLFFIPVAFAITASMTLPLIETIFAKNFSIRDAFNLKMISNIIFNNFWHYIILYLSVFALYLIAIIPFAISAITVVGVVLLPFLSFIMKLLENSLFAQFYNTIYTFEGEKECKH